MDVFKTKPGIPESLHILEETFTNATNKQVPYYTEGEHGRNARCFAVCPLCDNPIQISGYTKRMTKLESRTADIIRRIF